MLEYLEKVIDTTSIEDLWAIHTEEMARYGFDRLMYGFTRFRTKTSLGNREDMLILSNHAPEYLKRFLEGGLYFDAPMLRWAVENEGAKSWQWLADRVETMSDKEREVMAFNKSMGVVAGYTISFRDSRTHSKGAIALTAREGLHQHEVDALWAEKGREITVMNNLAHLKLTSLPHSGRGRALTPRQREALEWIGSGKTTQDTAVLMGLTPATVEKHLRLAREALDVETTAHAVLKASVQNQIFIIGT